MFLFGRHILHTALKSAKKPGSHAAFLKKKFNVGATSYGLKESLPSSSRIIFSFFRVIWHLLAFIPSNHHS